MGSIRKSRFIVGILLAVALLLIVNLSASAPPNVPGLAAPDNQKITNDNTPYFSWENLTGENILNYHLVVDNDSNFADVDNFYDNSNLTDNFDNFDTHSENALPEGTWYWHVSGENADGLGAWSETWTLTVDVTRPTAQIAVSDTLISDADAGSKLTVTITYSEVMDNSVYPSISFTPDVTADTLTHSENWWSADNTIYYENYTIGDENVENVGVDVSVTGGKDLAGNDQVDNTGENMFDVDTLNPTAQIAVSDTLISDADAGSKLTVTITYSEVMDNSVYPSISFTPDVTADTLTYSENWWSADNTIYYENYTIGDEDVENADVNVSVTGGKDLAGNPQVDNTGENMFDVDTKAPTISGITESSVGQTSATINWTTDELANSVVEYGTTTSYGTTESDSSLVTSHSITLTNLSGNTTYHYRVKSTDAANNTTTSSDQQFTTTPLIAPTSSVDNITPYWQSSASVTITATASDNDGTVENVTLWYRYRENSGASWGSWDNFGVDNSSPWSWAFDAPDNDGLYEFYTRATDNDDQTEAAPSTADENAGFDTVAPTISSVQINGENTVTPSTSVVISIVAQDNFSGLDQMRFSDDNENWTDWEPFASENDYVLPAGDENKRVYVKVKDNAGNESAMVDNWIVLETGVYVESLGTIAENENTLADFGQFGLLVTGINLFAKDNIDNVEVEVKVVQEKPAEVSEAAPGTATYYFEVETNALADNLDNVEIRFDVAKSWLDNLGIGAADVKLWKLDNTWQEVSTTIVGENASHVHFSATVPSLSWFAVTGEKPAAPIPYLPVAAGVIIIVVILIVLIWWWKKQSLSSASSQGVGVAGESQAHLEWALNLKEP